VDSEIRVRDVREYMHNHFSLMRQYVIDGLVIEVFTASTDKSPESPPTVEGGR